MRPVPGVPPSFVHAPGQRERLGPTGSGGRGAPLGIAHPDARGELRGASGAG